MVDLTSNPRNNNALEFHLLTVVRKEIETKGTVSIYLTIPAKLKDFFTWHSGQHVQVKLTLDDKQHIRHYSISSAANTAELRITVKDSCKGTVSKFINNDLSISDTLLVSKPKGDFTLCPDNNARNSYYFFCAGSGVTPIFSMISNLLNAEPESIAYLLYGNPDTKSTIFNQELTELAEKNNSRLIVKHCHSSPSWFEYSPWRTGRVDSKAVAEFIKCYPPYIQDVQYYICGPGDFIPIVKMALNEMDVPNNRIHMESFGPKKAQLKQKSIKANLTVSLNKSQKKLTINSGQTLLSAMKEKPLSVPFSCESGICGTCRCKLISGEVTMINNLFLSKEQEQQGYILACQSLAESEEIVISYS